MSAIDKALSLIKRFEGCRLTAYKPLPTDPWTIGYGATGPDINQKTVWTQDQAETDLRRRIDEIVNQLRGLIRVPISFSKVAALISFVYNVGINAFTQSTMRALINAGKPQEAADQFLRWTHSGGQVVQGLVNRRNAEREVFLEE